ncbi:hypothetical protein [Limnohabitans sp.]|jgi:hypothetical protein|uniref:hypothetical protein n=1 Tax=Limnohabitans sp. TaxID=1907725 RepID=UPI0037C0C1C4
MEAFALAFMAMGLLVLLVFIMYLLDRVNTLERETRLLTRPLNAPKEVALAGPFAGLSSKKLWDAMSGRLPDGLDASTVDEVRVLYETVLHKHVDAIFQEGVKDGQRGMLGEPKNTKLINTSHGPVESWLPSAQVNTLYKCGLDSAQLPSDQLDAVRAALDEAGQTLYGKAMVNLAQPLSASLMPLPVAELPILAPPAAP